MMYAIIKTGGKQVKVSEGNVLSVEKLTGEAGTKVELNQVLMLNNDGKLTLGTPMVAGASVTAEIVEQFKDKKVIIFKKKRRQNYRRKNGHRQNLTSIKITKINAK